MNLKFEIPIVLIIFNRPELTKICLDEIIKINPKKLYVICDGPRNSVEYEFLEVDKCRKLIEDIKIDCEVIKYYSKENMGCKKRIISGLNFVFENEKFAIILEDDCIATNDFFHYCKELLYKYEFNQEIFSISGSCFDYSLEKIGHIKSKYSLMWGWATWADRWRFYIESPPDYIAVILSTFKYRIIKIVYWIQVFHRLESGYYDTWDYQWILTVWRNSAYCCRPTKNLVKNIGFGVKATHNNDLNTPLINMPSYNNRLNYSHLITDKKTINRIYKADETKWASIKISSILGSKFPILVKFKKILYTMKLNSEN